MALTKQIARQIDYDDPTFEEIIERTIAIVLEEAAEVAEIKHDLWTKNRDGSSTDIPRRIEELCLILRTAILQEAVGEKETAAAIRAMLE